MELCLPYYNIFYQYLTANHKKLVEDLTPKYQQNATWTILTPIAIQLDIWLHPVVRWEFPPWRPLLSSHMNLSPGRIWQCYIVRVQIPYSPSSQEEAVPEPCRLSKMHLSFHERLVISYIFHSSQIEVTRLLHSHSKGIFMLWVVLTFKFEN